MNQESRKSMKCLFVRVGALGDLFFCLPHLQQARKQFQSRGLVLDWDFLTGAPYKELLSKMPFLHKVHSVSYEELYSKNFLLRIKALFQLWRSMRASLFDYDKIFISHRSFFYAFLLFLWTWKRPYQLIRSEVEDPFWKKWFRRGVLVPPLTLHESLGIQKMIEIGFSLSLGRPFLDTNDYPNSIENLRLDLILHVGGGRNIGNEFVLKKWPYFKDLLNLISENTQWTVALVGSAEERPEISSMIQDFPPERFVNNAGELTLWELFLLIKNTRVFLGGDSGPLHIAEALQIPCVGLYGPTSEISWGLRSSNSRPLFVSGISCRPCYKDDGYFPDCPHQQICLKSLSASEVFKTLRTFVELEKKR